MKFIFLGGISPNSEKEKLNKYCYGPIQPAADKLQWNFVKGFETNLKSKMLIINSYFIGTYPKYCKKIIFTGSKWKDSDHVNAYNIFFINLKILQHFSKLISLRNIFIKMLKEINDDQIYLVIYSAYFPFLIITKLIKKISSKIKICLIVPDLPEYMNLSSKKSLYRYVSSLTSKKIVNSYLKYIDSFVLLTDQMNQEINLYRKPYIVIEGMVSTDNHNIISTSKETNELFITYTGTLHKKYGILHLLEAFKLIKKKNYRLIICGNGEAREDILLASKSDSRIKYLGQLDENEIREIQSKSTVLVNPRMNNDEYTKYSFPSKNLEYLATGVPTVAYKLDGITDDYSNYMKFVDGNRPEDLARTLIEVCSLSEKSRKEIGLKAKEYVFNNKNNLIQTSKIITMLLD